MLQQRHMLHYQVMCLCRLLLPCRILFLQHLYQHHQFLDIVQLEGFIELMNLLDIYSLHEMQRKILKKFITENTSLTKRGDVVLMLESIV